MYRYVSRIRIIILGGNYQDLTIGDPQVTTGFHTKKMKILWFAGTPSLGNLHAMMYHVYILWQSGHSLHCKPRHFKVLWRPSMTKRPADAKWENPSGIGEAKITHLSNSWLHRHVIHVYATNLSKAFHTCLDIFRPQTKTRKKTEGGRDMFG